MADGDKVKSGTIVLTLDNAGTPVVIGGKTGVTLKRGTVTDDATTLESASEENEPMLTNWSVDIDGFIVSGDAGRTALLAAWRTKAQVDVVYTCDGDEETGKATVMDVSDTAASKKLGVCKVSLQGSGALALTPPEGG